MIDFHDWFSKSVRDWSVYRRSWILPHRIPYGKICISGMSLAYAIGENLVRNWWEVVYKSTHTWTDRKLAWSLNTDCRELLTTTSCGHVIRWEVKQSKWNEISYLQEEDMLLFYLLYIIGRWSLPQDVVVYSFVNIYAHRMPKIEGIFCAISEGEKLGELSEKLVRSSDAGTNISKRCAKFQSSGWRCAHGLR